MRHLAKDLGRTTNNSRNNKTNKQYNRRELMNIQTKSLSVQMITELR